MGEWLLFAAFGFIWGQWFAERKPKRSADPALTLISNMIAEIETKRRFVGLTCTITRSEKFDFRGGAYTLSVASLGNPVKEHA